MRVLLVKMSSLGDVVHALVGVTDAARALPDLELDWVVEEAYHDIPGWHPAVRRIIRFPLRRLRKSPRRLANPSEWAGFRRELRRESYDLILDAQGLLKSAFVGLQARGPIAGRNSASAREGAAALLYRKRHPIDLNLTEVEQLRQLFARSLGYPTPDDPADFGIDPARLSEINVEGKYVVFIHGAAWPAKLWPDDNWIALGRELARSGLKVLIPWGNEAEKQRAAALAAKFGGQVLPPLDIPGLASVLAQSQFVVGLDTGLTHIAIALGKRTVTLYGPSIPVYDRVARGELINLTSSDSKTVDTSRPNTVPIEAVTIAVAPWKSAIAI